MKNIQGLSLVSASNAHVLILGSMPGRASLDVARYYAHPRNAFWFIIEAHFSIFRQLPYEQRLSLLTENGVALWDVMKSCVRESSLDSDIVTSSVVANDFESFFNEHSNIRRVFLNGAMAAQSYVKHVLPTLSVTHRNIPYYQLPSTSPANARMSLEQKIDAWAVIAE